MTRRVIRANLQLLGPHEGGRTSPIQSGYRSLAGFEGFESEFGFELDLDGGQLAPGDSGTGRLSFWAVEDLPDLAAGLSFELREGARVVGHGTVSESEV